MYFFSFLLLVLYSVLGIPRGSKYFQPIIWGGNGMVIDYQDFIEDVNISTDDDGL